MFLLQRKLSRDRVREKIILGQIHWQTTILTFPHLLLLLLLPPQELRFTAIKSLIYTPCYKEICTRANSDIFFLDIKTVLSFVISKNFAIG